MQKFAQKILAATCLCFALIGCQETLYSQLSETEVNDMVAILARSEISSNRVKNAKDDTYNIQVNKNDLAQAIITLKAKGYPKKKFKSIGDVFETTGIIATPFDQRAKFIYALNQELSETISRISGVREARVHVMLPVTERYSKNKQTATASVTIQYIEGSKIDKKIAIIKNLITHSVPNLSYEDVAIALFVVEENKKQPPTKKKLSSNTVHSSLMGDLQALILPYIKNKTELLMVGIITFSLAIVLMILKFYAIIARYRNGS